MESQILRNHCLWQKSWTGGSSITPIKLQSRDKRSSNSSSTSSSKIYKQLIKENKNVHILPIYSDSPVPSQSSGSSITKFSDQSPRSLKLTSNPRVTRPERRCSSVPANLSGAVSQRNNGGYSKSNFEVLEERRSTRITRRKPWTEKATFGKSRRDSDVDLRYRRELPEKFDEETVKRITRKYVSNLKYGNLYELRHPKSEKGTEGQEIEKDTSHWMWEQEFQLWLHEKDYKIPKHGFSREWAWEIERNSPRVDKKSQQSRSSSRQKSVRWSDRPHPDFFAIYHSKRLEYQRRCEAAIQIQRIFRGWSVRNFLGKLKRKVLLEHGCSWKKFVNDYRNLVMRVQERYGIKKPACGLVLHEIAVFMENKKKYEDCFVRLAYGDKLLKNALENFFNECGLFPTPGEISKAFDSVFKGSGNTAEVVFVMDCSTSVGPLSFYHLTKFVKDVVNSFEIAPDKVRVGVIPYSTDVYSYFGVTRYNMKHEVTTAIDTIQHKEGSTRTDRAIEKMRALLLASRPGVRRLGIVITDGKSSEPAKTKIAAKAAHDDNIEIIAIGVGKGVDEMELKNIASSEKYVFKCCDYQALGSLKRTVASKTCLAACVLCQTIVPRIRDIGFYKSETLEMLWSLYPPPGCEISCFLALPDEMAKVKQSNEAEKCRPLKKQEVMETLWTVYPPAATNLPAVRVSRWIRPVIAGTEAWSLLDKSVMASTDIKVCLRLVIQAKIEREGFITLPVDTANGIREVNNCEEALSMVEKWMEEQKREEEKENREIILNM